MSNTVEMKQVRLHQGIDFELEMGDELLYPSYKEGVIGTLEKKHTICYFITHMLFLRRIIFVLLSTENIFCFSSKTFEQG
ncbi:hypothetical protein SAMN04244570_2727 [Sporosarcina newyorkensis]|uniref:Uncharacterized protein n=1 Tax=Sporosarcina newyorkensis TaxID=759851 RepID=A0A1T4YHZ9_9BACL|nr:hypothetical protein SAMN04244570_2727 [Sporosarcina newyorkensis]